MVSMPLDVKWFNLDTLQRSNVQHPSARPNIHPRLVSPFKDENIFKSRFLLGQAHVLWTNERVSNDGVWYVRR